MNDDFVLAAVNLQALEAVQALQLSATTVAAVPSQLAAMQVEIDALATEIGTQGPVPANIKIMLMGDSITHGDNASNGCRTFLWQRLRIHGSNFTFLGTQILGDPPRTVLGDWHHEGHPGVEAEGLSPATYFATAGIPDLVCLTIGTNNVGSVAQQSATEALGHLATLLGQIRSAAPSCKILLFTIPPCLSPNANAAACNTQVTAYNAGLAAAAAVVGATLTVIPWDVSHMSLDGTHPNYPRGYSLMADYYAAAILAAVHIGGDVVPRPAAVRIPAYVVELCNPSTDNIVIPYGAGLAPSGASSFTAAIDFYPLALPVAAKRVLMQYGTVHASGFLVAQVGDGIAVYLKGVLLFTATGLLLREHWHRVIVAFDAALLECRLYLTRDDLDINPLVGHLGYMANGLSAWNITALEATTIGFTAADLGVVGCVSNYEFAAGVAAGLADAEADWRDAKGLPGECAHYAFDESSGATLADYARFGGPNATLAGINPGAGMRRPLVGSTVGLVPKPYDGLPTILETDQLQALSDAGKLTLWVEPSRGGVTLNRTTGTAMRIADLAGLNGAFFAQGGSQPTYDAAALNGQPGLVFDGIAQFLGNVSTGQILSSAVASTTAFTIWAVVQVWRIATNSGTVHANDSILQGSGTRLGLVLTASSPPAAIVFGYDGSYKSAASSTLALGKPQLIECRLDAGNLYISINGGSDSAPSACGTLQFAGEDLYLGKSDSTQFFHGILGALIVTNTVPSSGTRAAVRAQLMTRYGISTDTTGYTPS